MKLNQCVVTRGFVNQIVFLRVANGYRCGNASGVVYFAVIAIVAGGNHTGDPNGAQIGNSGGEGGVLCIARGRKSA